VGDQLGSPLGRPSAGISEARRVLAAGGRLVLAERMAKPAARGHAAHGLTRDQAEDLTRQLTAASFGQVRLYTAKAGLRTVIIIRGQKDPAAPTGNPGEH
jgi:hypothetical protein